MSARILLVFVPLLLFACHETDKHAVPKSVNTATFDSSVGKSLTQYYALTGKFVAWDSTAIGASQSAFGNSLKAFMRDGKYPPALMPTVHALEDMIRSKSLPEKRMALNDLTRAYFSFLKDTKYNGSPVYLNYCPMAFNDEDTGRWLSDVDSIRNPYLGLHHPVYGKAMVECGSNEAKLGVN